MPKPLEVVYRYEDENPVVKGVNGPVLCIIASLFFLMLSIVGISVAFIYGVAHETLEQKITIETE